MKKEISITIPQKWADVDLNCYQKYISKIDDIENEDDIVIHSIASLCGVPEKFVKKLKREDIKKIYEKLSKIISVPVNKKIYNKIEIKGVKYGFHPNLDEMTLGEFVDIEENSKGGVGSFHNVLSVLYRPIIKEEKGKYDIEPYETKHLENSELFKTLSIDIVNGVMIFFYTLGNKLFTNDSSSTKKSARGNYGWFAIIDSLAGGDILKFDSITELPFRLCFIKLQMMKDEAREKQKNK